MQVRVNGGVGWCEQSKISIIIIISIVCICIMSIIRLATNQRGVVPVRRDTAEAGDSGILEGVGTVELLLGGDTAALLAAPRWAPFSILCDYGSPSTHSGGGATSPGISDSSRVMIKQ